MPDTTAQDDLLIVAALARCSYQFETAEPQLADQAWMLAVAIATANGLEPGEAVLHLDCSPNEITPKESNDD